MTLTYHLFSSPFVLTICYTTVVHSGHLPVNTLHSFPRNWLHSFKLLKVCRTTEQHFNDASINTLRTRLKASHFTMCRQLIIQSNVVDFVLPCPQFI